MSRRTAIIGFAAAGVLLAIWFLLLWGPQGGELDKADERQEAAEAKNQELELRLARLRATQERAPSLQAELSELRAAVPDDPDLAQFILDVHTIAEESGVEFTSINQTPPAASTTGGPPSIALTINITGGYFEVLDYLDRLDSLSRIVVIDNLSLAPGGGEGGPLEVTASIIARMFTTSTNIAGVTPTPVVSTSPAPSTTAPPAEGATTTTAAPTTETTATTPTTTGATGG